MLHIELQGENMALLPERAVWWEKEKTLIIADLHWGKSAHFRKNGIAIPSQTQSNDEIRLAKVLREKGIERLIIAGDLFHSTSNQQVDLFLHFRKYHTSLHVDLVVGNHDILKEEQYNSFNLEKHEKCLQIGPFCFAHDMLPSNQFVIHGHVHPALQIKSKGFKQPALKLCCFAEDKERMILPAFGKFTGNYMLEPQNFAHLYLATETNVIQWK